MKDHSRDYFISGHEGKIWAGQLVGNSNTETSEDFTSIIMLKLSKMVLTTYLVQTRERGTIYRPATPQNALILGGLHRKYTSFKSTKVSKSINIFHKKF